MRSREKFVMREHLWFYKQTGLLQLDKTVTNRHDCYKQTQLLQIDTIVTSRLGCWVEHMPSSIELPSSVSFRPSYNCTLYSLRQGLAVSPRLALNSCALVILLTQCPQQPTTCITTPDSYDFLCSCVCFCLTCFLKPDPQSSASDSSLQLVEIPGIPPCLSAFYPGQLSRKLYSIISRLQNRGRVG